MKILVMNCSPVKTGATDRIVNLISDFIKEGNEINKVCIHDYHFDFCKGCRSCHQTAECVMDDDVKKLMNEFNEADKIVLVSPSYWADIPGEFKAFIDRCTPWCNTHEPYAKLSPGKKGYAVALRTGPNLKECERVLSSITHFYGHLEIETVKTLSLPSVENKEDVNKKLDEIKDFCKVILSN